MKERKLAPLIALAIGLEMILAPVAVVAKEREVSASDVFGTVLGVTSSIYEQIRTQNIPPSPHVAGDMAAFQRQQTPVPDKYFNAQKLSQIPGLGQYLAINGINPQQLNCVTLPTTLHEAHNEVCRVGITTDKGPPVVQAQEAHAYMAQYTAIDKMYRNFSTQSNVGGELFGVGCMKNAMQILNGFFRYRTDELDKLVTNLESIQNSFKEAAKADLDAIEEATAVLNGGDSELADKVKTRRPDLLDFGKRFDNPACLSMFSKDQFNKTGQGGLNGINQLLQDTASEKVGAMQFSGESYSRSHADVISDINSLAEKAGKQMELNFETLTDGNKGYSDVLKGMGGLSSSNKLGGALSADLFSDVQTRFSENNDKLKSSLTDIASELGESGGRAYALIRNNNSAAFESEVSSIETRLKNECLRGQAQIDTVIGKIYDPSASGFANKNASNFLKDKLRQIMENDKTSFEKKLAELKALESTQGKRYLVKMENSYEVQDVNADGKLVSKVVEASTARTPGVFFADVIKNCEAQFKTNNLNNKMTGAAAVQKLRQLHQDYKNLAKSHAREVKEELKKKLIQCDSPTKANNSIAGSCSPNSFDTSRPGFCANAALSCSKNMQTCSKGAQKFVTEIKQERTIRVNNYKKMVEKNKNDVIKLFDSALARYMRDGEMLRGQFGVGFSSPSDIQREVPEGQKHLALFQQATAGSADGTLLLEDPDKFVAMFKANINLLKNSVIEQQEQILGNGVGSNSGILAKHAEDTRKNYDKVSKEASTFAEKCKTKHDNFIAEMEGQRKEQAKQQAQKMSELGQKKSEFCRRYSMAQTNPVPGCDGNVDDLINTIGNLDPQGASAANELQRVCTGLTEGGAGNPIRQALKFCRNDSASTEPSMSKDCEALMKCTKKDPIFDDRGNISGYEPTCDSDEKLMLAEMIVESNGGKYTVDADLKPVYCPNEYDGMGSPKNFFDSVGQGLQRGLSGTGQ